MERKAVSTMMLTLLLIGMLTLAFEMRPVKPEAATTIVPDDHPTIQEAINAASTGGTVYVRAGTYHENVVVNKTVSLIGEEQNAIIIGNEDGTAIRVTSNHVAVRGFTIQSVNALLDYRGIFVGANFVNIVGNTIINASYGIIVGGNSNIVTANIITHNFRSIVLSGYGNAVSSNAMRDNAHGVCPQWGENNTIAYNSITNNDVGIEFLMENRRIRIVNNVLANNGVGIDFIFFGHNMDNIIHHNNFINNSRQVVYETLTANTWDNGYPAGGNYWSDYSGTDLYSGPFQNETGSDGIGDMPYTMNANNTDRYPLMSPIVLTHDIAVTSILSKTIVGQGYTVLIDVTVENQGDNIETFAITTFVNTTTVQTKNITLGRRSLTIINFRWNTSGFAKGNYTISAYVEPVVGEVDTADNNFTKGWVIVAMIGDIAGPEGCGFPDGKVDIKDIACVAIRFGIIYPDPNYNPNCDLTGPKTGVADGKIDIRDIATVAKHFGEIDP